MNSPDVIIQGTIKPDGTLELDMKPGLAPGRVTVVFRPEAEIAGTQGDWWQFMQESRRSLETAGSGFMYEEEVQAHVKWLREEDPIG